jgi:hypothetical protein
MVASACRVFVSNRLMCDIGLLEQARGCLGQLGSPVCRRLRQHARTINYRYSGDDGFCGHTDNPNGVSRM